MRNRLPWRWQLAALPLLLAAIWFSNLRETRRTVAARRYAARGR